VAIQFYHVSEYVTKDREVIKEFIKDYDYIAIGGMAGVSHSKDLLIKFLDYVFSITRDKIKIHGLGVTNVKLLEKYPFYSTDSTSWLSMGRYGQAKSLSKKEAFFLKKTENWRKNVVHDIHFYKKIQDNITNLWEKRGIVWQ
jgi:hypothetical protein